MPLTQVQPGMLGTPQPYNFKNRLINGAMVISQGAQGASVTPAVSSTYATNFPVDRWKCYATQASKYTVQQNAGSVTPPSGFTNYIGHTSSSAYSVAAGDYFMGLQAIEGYNFADLGWGTSAAQTVTLSFWVRSSLTGTFGGSVINYPNSRSYPFSYTISAANTWEYKTITIPGDTNSLWATGNSTTNGVGAYVLWSLGMGSNFKGPANTWASAGYFSVTGETSIVGTSGATLYITGTQIEVGVSATTFDARPYTTELQLCQRYCIAYVPGKSDSSIGIGSWRSTTSAFIYIPLPVEMRSTISMNYSAISDWGASLEGFHGGGQSGFTSGLTLDTTTNTKVAFVYGDYSSGTGTQYRVTSLSSTTSSAKLIFSSEL
jgi:hypothetical protein